MKSRLVIFSFFVLLSTVTFGQRRLAEIEAPVVTEFGVYQPQLVTVQPDAPACDPGANLEKLSNLQRFDLSEEALALLKKNHFFVTPVTRPRQLSSTTGCNEMFDLYCENREQGVPNFITSDAMLHAFHLCFDTILKTCEEKRFIGRLNRLLDGLLQETINQHQESEESTIRAALNVNLNYLIVAKRLLDSSYVEPINGGVYLEELALIEDASLYVQSPLFHYEEDYTQYIVRGHYTRSSALSRYFRSMIWLGRMTFSCEGVQDPFSREATRSALLLLQAFQRLQIDGQPALTAWDEIYQPTVFFVGKSDDINLLTYLPLIEQVYGEDFAAKSAALFLDEALLTGFLQKTEALPAAAIQYPGQPAKGFRFMGQRFIPDSYVLDHVVYPYVATRTMPTGLDVMQVLGSERAFELLPDKDRRDAHYLKAIDSLKTEFAAYPAGAWAQNLYWNWLYTLMPLLWVKGEGYPHFMQTAAWVDKDLYAALASWAELRHDTILYAKQSGSKTGMDPTALLVQGYVEPNPHFFGRIASLADFLTKGLMSRNLLFEEFSETLNLFTETALKFKTVAEKELSSQPLSGQEYSLIFEFGKVLYRIVTFNRGGTAGPYYDAKQSGLEPMPVVADVHTDVESGTVLEEGVGYPFAVYVICNIEGVPVLTRGAGYSYYEFTQPMTDRLSDERWREQLTSTAPPQPVAWSSSFSADLPAHNPMPTFYLWNRPATEWVQAVFDTSSQTVNQGDSLRISIQAHVEWPTDLPSVRIENDHMQWTVDNVTLVPWSSSQIFRAVYPTDHLPVGMYHLVISLPVSGGPLVYRTQFTVTNTVGVRDKLISADRFELSCNWPNPFNASTVIAYELPSDQDVTLEIYNVRGEKVITLFSGRQTAGRHQIRWHTADAASLPLSSGVYFLRLSGSQFETIRPLSLIK
ncbi:MAG TPA: DUF3160 domain-containing protein [bacterium]|nr:DUF3160 domain-containing protein [bacterium]HQJ65919.1 DUF3160 domain-containing protein [bacterium]